MSGTLAEYEQLKAFAFSRFAEIENEIANLKPPWRVLKQAELGKRKQLMFGPELSKANELRPLLEWSAMAAEYRRAFCDAVAAGDYRRALLREGWARYAEYQAGLLQTETFRDAQVLVPGLGGISDHNCTANRPPS